MGGTCSTREAKPGKLEHADITA